MTVPAATHSDSACKASRHARVQHLITADEASLPDLELLLATLPICSTGRVFIEVADAASIGHVTVPARMVVTWLDRSARTGTPGSGRACAPGQALTRAVVAWADEMLCADAHLSADEQGTRIHLLGGFLGTADIFDHLTTTLGIHAGAVHVPERFGLATSR